jgi:thymidylate kinase
MYICLEGLKGCGKSTLLAAVQTLLTSRGISFALVEPTRPMPIEQSWQERLSAKLPCLRRLDAWNELLYAHRARYATATARWQAPIVLGDRSLITSYATRWRKWGSPHECIRRVNRLEDHIPAPDHVVLLEVDPQLAWARAQARRRNYGQQDESLARLCEAREAYHQIAAFGIPRLQCTRWHVLDGSQAPELVLQNWLELMQQLVPTAFSFPEVN